MQSSLPIPQHIPEFLDYCEIEKGLSNNTQKNYRQYLSLFVKWLKATGKEKLFPHQLTAQHIWNYRLYLARQYKTPRKRYLTKKSQNYYLIALRVLLNYFTERDIETIPSSKVKLAKQKGDDNISFLEINDVEKLLAVPDTSTYIGLRNRAILELLFSTGMRISELLLLSTEQVSFLRDDNKNKTYELSIIGKGKRARTIFISPRAADWLRRYLKKKRGSYKPLFTNSRAKMGDPDDAHLSARYVQAMVSRYSILAGLSKKVTPHTLRHTYATDLLSMGADLRSVQELLGHKNVSTTQVYTHVTNKKLRDIHERFHSGRTMSNK